MNLPEGKLELCHRPSEDNRITDKAVADDIASRTRGVPTNLKVEKKPKTFSPPTPYSLPELQMAASARWGWSAKKTLDVLQKLYEAGAVTYPRTDAGHLTDEMIPDMRSEEHTSELQSLMRISYAVFCLKKNITQVNH